MSRSQTTLTKMEDFALMSFMKERLEASGLQAREFAELAAKELGNPKINKDHLYYRANALGLKIAERRTAADASVSLAALEGQVGDILTYVRGLRERVGELEETVKIIKLAAKNNKS